MDLQHVKFENVVGLDLDRAKRLIDDKMKTYKVSYSIYVKMYTFKNKKEAQPQNQNQIVVWVDKNNEVVTTPFIQFTKKSSMVDKKDEENDYDEQEREQRYHEYMVEDDFYY